MNTPAHLPLPRAVHDLDAIAKARPIAFIGVDPGATGCAALIHDGGQELLDWPGDAALVVPRLADWLARFEVRLAALEKVHAMPGQGVVSMFSFGQNVGTWQGILAALSIPYVTPRPQEWQKGLVDHKAGRHQGRIHRHGPTAVPRGIAGPGKGPWPGRRAAHRMVGEAAIGGREIAITNGYH